MPNFKNRSYEPEIMDDLEMEGEELASTLRQIANVNKWLGGTSVSVSAVKKIINKNKNSDRVIKIADLGCGGGEVLREIAIWARKNNIKLALTGFDANAYTVEFAALLSQNFPEISYKQLNVFEFEAEENDYDITLCCLFLHHFNEDDIVLILKKLYQISALGVIINDLQRSPIAYYLFKMLTYVLGASYMVRHDGLLSIRKSFIRQELNDFRTTLAVNNYSIQWKWAFRYEVLLLKTKQ